jgi:hypothetical protein
MRSRDEDALAGVVREVHVAVARCEDVLVGALLQALHEHRRPGHAVIVGACHVLAGLVVLHVGGIQRRTVGRIDDDLRVVLPSIGRRQRSRLSPRRPTVARDLQLGMRARTADAERVVAVVAPDGVDAAQHVRGDRRLPVVAGGEAESLRRGERRRRRSAEEQERGNEQGWRGEQSAVHAAL